MTTDLMKAKAISPSSLRRHLPAFTALFFWLLVVGGSWWYADANNLTVADGIRALSNVLSGALVGPLIYIVVYAVRPLIFFPATLLTLLGGFIFGPLGILYTIIGANSSALVAYGAGRFFGGDLLDSDDASRLQRYTARLRNNSFETVLLMRLLFLPYDLVNYAAGFFKINWRAFLLATVIGSIPGTVSFVLLGMSFGMLEELLNGDIGLNPWSLAFSVALLLGSLTVSRILRRREERAKGTL